MLSKERLEEIGSAELPKGRAVRFVAELLDHADDMEKHLLRCHAHVSSELMRLGVSRDDAAHVLNIFRYPTMPPGAPKGWQP